jgi:hypothetical protein
MKLVQRRKNINPQREFIIDSSGAPAVKFNDNKYIGVLPITRYQFERFIWKTAPDWCHYKRPLNASIPFSPLNLRLEHITYLFMTGLNAEEANLYAEYFGTRIPSLKEWDCAYETLFVKNDLIFEALRFMKMQNEVKEDNRVLKLLEGIHRLGLVRSELNTKISEMVFEFTEKPFGEIYLKISDRESGQVLGPNAQKIKCEKSGFSVVLKE